MRDFSIVKYSNLLRTFIEHGYHCTSYLDFFVNGHKYDKVVILRHDVDAKPQNSLRLARIQNDHGVCGTYYFRMVKKSYDKGYIKEITMLGHEIGYHYEDLSLRRGDSKSAIVNFERNLQILRQLHPVRTICMHGSPLSKFDNRDIWKKYDYRNYDIIAEPYFDTDFNEVFYISDTGRKWNNTASNVRDKVDSKIRLEIRDTNHLMELIRSEYLPKKVMLNIHPQRWNDDLPAWAGELVSQNIKNVVKMAIAGKKN